jgi:hypothetical protein
VLFSFRPFVGRRLLHSAVFFEAIRWEEAATQCLPRVIVMAQLTCVYTEHGIVVA